MLASHIGDMIAELDEAIAAGDCRRRQTILRRITDLFVLTAPQAERALVDVFGVVLSRLLTTAAPDAREELAERLAPFDNAPSAVIVDLAMEREARIAGPVLRRSPVLQDDDLVRIARERGDDHRVAIAERDGLSEEVTDILVERGDRAVVCRVAENESARFSGPGYRMLVDRARLDAALAAVVSLRRDLPDAALDLLVEQAADAVVGRLTPAPTARAAMATMARDLAEQAALRARALQQSRIEVRDLAGNGTLDQGLVDAFESRDEHAHAIAAFAEIAGIPDQVALRFWQPNGSELVLIVAKSAGLSWPTAQAALRASRYGSELSAAELAEARTTFQRLASGLCQRIVRFWKAREAACREDAVAW